MEAKWNYLKWYEQQLPILKDLSIEIEATLNKIIKEQQITCHAVSARVKESHSFSKKIQKTKYTDPINQIQDGLGLRIITYFESDLEKICALIEANFDIDKANSIDKREHLGVDRVGYLSIHYIAKLTEQQLLETPELEKFRDCVFEIQVRTLLQHTWAEIEHDKNYKFAGELPKHLKRRFTLLAALLEMADREFNELSKEIDNYSQKVSADSHKGNLSASIDSTSIKSYMDYKFSKLIELGILNSFLKDTYEGRLIEELRSFGVTTLADLDSMIPADIVENYRKGVNMDILKKYNYSGLIRDIMLINDADLYFETIWKAQWNFIYQDQFRLIMSYSDRIKHYVDNGFIRVIA